MYQGLGEDYWNCWGGWRQKRRWKRPRRLPSPPGKWANEKHTLAGTVFTREFNYPVFRSRCFPFGFGVGFFFQLTEAARPLNLTLKDS